MTLSVRTILRSIAAVLCYAVLFNQMAHAAKLPRGLAHLQALLQQAQPAPVASDPAPSPEAVAQARLLAAKNIFIVSDGSDDAFPTTPAAGHDRFAAAMRSWGRYNIVSSIAEADVVLQLREAVTTTVVDGTTDSPSASVYHNPFFRLTIADPSSLKPLWVITVPVRTGTRKKDKADLFSISAQNLTSQLKLLVGQPLTTTETAELRTANTASGRSMLWLILPAVLVGGAIVGGIMMKRKFDENVANQNAALCKQNPFFCTH
jgi:hypothetical protein